MELVGLVRKQDRLTGFDGQAALLLFLLSLLERKSTE
jgi:hypothetical protein